VPIYEYECASCKRHFEYMQKMSDPPRKKCESCGGKLERLISAAGFQLKGTGWYKTDYAARPAGGDTGNREPAQEKTDKPSADKEKPKEKKDRD